MPIQPTADQLNQLKTAIRSSFTYHELKEMTQLHLSFQLDWFTPVLGDLTAIVDALVDYAASQPNGLHQLLTAAATERPQNPELTQLAAEWADLDFAPVDLPPDHPAVTIHNQTLNAQTVNTSGGMVNSGSIETNGGDVIGRDQIINYITAGERPPLFVDVPTMPNHFVGRDDLMSQIINQLIGRDDNEAAENNQAQNSEAQNSEAKNNDGSPVALSAEGLPGVGKTTLAVAVAYHPDVRQHFADGILWAGVGPNGDVMSLLAGWGDALGVDVTHHVEPARRAAAVKNAIGHKRFLLILDDVWEADAAQRMQCGGPNCCHLLTTRDQQIARDFAGPSCATPIPTLEQEPAYDLLRQLAPTAWDADPLQAQSLVDQVGHLPLAIELLGGYLSAETQSISPLFADLQNEALADLGDPARRLQLASQRLGDMSQSSVTLQATIELSLTSLPEDAQQAFARLGAFAPKPRTFDLDAARAVAQTDARTLALLAARNLLEAGTDDLALHQTVADVAATQTSPEDRANHSAYYLDLVNADRDDWQRIEPAYEQIQWAWERADDDQTRKELTYAIGTYQLRRGLYAERLDWLNTMLVKAQQNGQKDDEGYALNGLGVIYTYLANYDDALSYLEQSLAIRKEIGDKSGEGTTLNNMATTAHARGDYETALKYLEQSLAIRQEIGDISDEGTTLNNISQIYIVRGNYETALRYLEQSLAISQENGDKAREGTTLNNISEIYSARGDYETALKYLEQSLAISQEIGDISGEGTTLNNMATIAHAQGDHETALKYLNLSLAISQEIGDKAGEGITLNNISQIFKAQEDYEIALTYLGESLAISQEIGGKAGEGRTLNNISQIYSARGDTEMALIYLEKALTIHQEIGSALGENVTLNNIGRIYLKRGDLQKAEKMFLRVVEIGELIEHPNLESDRAFLQQIQAKLGKR